MPPELVVTRDNRLHTHTAASVSREACARDGVAVPPVTRIGELVLCGAGTAARAVHRQAVRTQGLAWPNGRRSACDTCTGDARARGRVQRRGRGLGEVQAFGHTWNAACCVPCTRDLWSRAHAPADERPRCCLLRQI